MKRALTFLTVLLIPCLIYASGSKPAGKPKPPVEVSIVEGEKVGNTVGLTVTVRSLVADVDTWLVIILAGGAQLVAGETEWRGPLSKGGERQIILFVRSSTKGKGMVRATAEFSAGEGISYRDMALYRFGAEADDEVKPGRAGKGGQGEDIIEYRVK